MKYFTFFACLTGSVLAGSLPAALVNINFTGSSNTTLATTDVAGLPAVADDNYNNISGNNGTNLALVNGAGTATAITLTFSAPGTFSSGVGTGTPNQRLFNGYIDGTDNGTNTVSLNNVPVGLYDVYIYSLPDSLDGRDMSLAINGGPATFLSSEGGANFNTNGFVLATATSKDGPGAVGNYTRFSNISPAAGAINIVGTSLNFRNFQNGLQLVAVVPEPGRAVLLGIAAFGMVNFRRRRNA